MVAGFAPAVNVSSLRKRWNFKKLDSDFFNAAVEFLASSGAPMDAVSNPEKYANWLVDLVSNACNVAGPIISRTNRRRQMYGGLKRYIDSGHLQLEPKEFGPRINGKVPTQLFIL